MPELRKDPIVERWVIISTERWKRPSDFRISRELPGRGAVCPFCPGNEALTPSEILSYRPEPGRPNAPDWTLRVVPNKFPALQIEGALNREGVGMFDKMNGIGAHEVIIESPDHKATFATMPEKDLENVFWSYRDRILDLKKDARLRYMLIFKNHGVEAGASLEHTHSQLIALPIIPSHVLEELHGAKEHFAEKERCIYCDVLKQEVNDGSRIVAENGDFVCLAPFAPRFPFEVWILPKTHASNFEEVHKSQVESLARMFVDVFRRLDRALDTPPYNLILHTSPLRDKTDEYHHWHFEIMPKLTEVAGFERGSGFYINPTPPEEAAKFLREVDL